MKSQQKIIDMRASLKFLEKKNSDFWFVEQKSEPIMLFHKAAENVPAYKDFLKQNKINPDKIKTWEDFQKVPIGTKSNYLRKYSLEKLCWNGTLDNKTVVFTATSGSTGEPFYFPRTQDLDWQYSLVIESFLKHKSFKTGPTLVVMCFGLGVWIGGILTYRALEIASQRSNNKVSIITPGINKKEIFNALKNLSPHYASTVLIGYAPFMKDIIDEAPANNVNLKKLHLNMIFAAEAFTENFRDYLAKKANIKNLFLDTMNIYGTADIGAMAYETPLSILIRRIACKKPKLFNDIFGSIAKTPTLAQFNPLFVNFECVEGNIVLTGNNEIPLIRYGIGDHGGVYSYNELSAILQKHNIDIIEEAKKSGIEEALNKLPFVFVYERKDFAIKLYGATIFPEHIREALLHFSVEVHLTGKFTLVKKFDKKHNQYMEIHCELRKGVVSSSALKEKIKKAVIKNLLEKNAEYHNNYKSIPGKVKPKIALWQNEHPLHFKPGAKQKWVEKI